MHMKPDVFISHSSRDAAAVSYSHFEFQKEG